ncbi:MAG TPA: HDOD domain-containing protein [Gammaproteobacteria bacterium]|nr:HDOD domain-containing protein [Gammaproteobacteria bacterium]
MSAIPTDARALITDSVELASLPSVVMKAMELLNNPRTSASDVGQIISQDPALSVRLLKIVNSAFYGFPSRIDTISRAITIVGTLELTDLILGASAIHAFEKIPNQLVNMEKFWDHSLYAGIVARILARYLRAPNTERCFIMGLLHDVGSLILFRQQPDRSRQALELCVEQSMPLHLAEREIFCFDHGEVGAELMHAWKLPACFIEVARHHHQPSAAECYRLETAVIHLADVITDMARGATISGKQVSPLEPGAWELTGLSVDVMEQVVAEADAQFEEARAAILPGIKAA